jgi:hypothetical protein
MIAIPTVVKWNINVVLTGISLVVKDVEHFFHEIIDHLYFF